MILFHKEHLEMKKVEWKEGLRIMSLNVHDLKAVVLKSKDEVLEEVLKVVKHYDLDLCCFQEFFDLGVKVEFEGYKFYSSH
jgi:hypothetical protein